MTRLFGFSIKNSVVEKPGSISPVPATNKDGLEYYSAGGFGGTFVDIEGIYRTESELIRRYRAMALYPEVSMAIQDIVDEAIAPDLRESPVQIELSNVTQSPSVKRQIRAEFKYIKELLDFDCRARDIFKNWYIDGRLHYFKVIDFQNPKDGIQALRYIDPLKIKFVRKLNDKAATNQFYNKTLTKNNIGKTPDALNNTYSPAISEYYEYRPGASTSTGLATGLSFGGGNKNKILFSKTTIAYCNSGVQDRNSQTCLSYLHFAIKAANQLKFQEDSIVIYRLTRAAERRIFYIDVGNLPKIKAEQYLHDVMQRYRNKMVFNSATGEIKDDKNFPAMTEDFWLPRREGGRGTQVDTLPAGQNLGELEDVKYFQQKLYDALHVPRTRAPGSNEGFNMGRSSEILRDEVKFSKFVAGLRKKFSNLFLDLLKSQLILKNIITLEDWEDIKDNVQFDYAHDNHFAELKEAELLQEKLNLALQCDQFVGKYYSAEWVRRNVLRQTDSEIKEIDEQIEEEIKAGIIPDPSQVDPITGAPLPPALGDVADEGAATMDQTAIDGQAGIVPTDSEVKLTPPRKGEI